MEAVFVSSEKRGAGVRISGVAVLGKSGFRSIKWAAEEGVGCFAFRIVADRVDTILQIVGNSEPGRSDRGEEKSEELKAMHDVVQGDERR